jgi:hypothetical protein
MSVFFENHGRDRGYDSDALPGESKVSAFLDRGGQVRRDRKERDDPPLWGYSYDRAEGVIHLLLAFSIVGGLAAILNSGLFAPDAPQIRKVESRPAASSPAAAPQQRADVKPISAPAAPPATATAVVEPAAPSPAEARPLAPMEKAESAAPSASLLDSRPLTEIAAASAKAPEPLAPPPTTMRGGPDPSEAPAESVADAGPPSVADAAPAPANEASAGEEAAPAAPRAAQAPRVEAKSEDRGRMARCYLKLSGRVQSSGSCRVRHTDDSVILDLPGKPLELAHAHGRTWIATLGGRNLGKVYRNGACWGAHGFYACENG